ncbi:hypothetical protein EVAR_98618_1 [Eumeta japonica]|uniref:Uncharacterized protein n=1 Tax=Eumeta variegata TaxID=151549 RepID=A0A4C1XY13_EUMVA|nr:hypothetical protein EVAR_98618_1 [Eumeta japonica]
MPLETSPIPHGRPQGLGHLSFDPVSIDWSPIGNEDPRWSSVLIGGRARDDYCTRNLLRYQSGAEARRFVPAIWENREYVCVMEDSGKGSRRATRDALHVAGGYSKCKYFNSVYLFGMKMNRWSEGPSVSQFRPYAGTALPL